MTNPYYGDTGTPSYRAFGNSRDIRTEFQLVEAGFDLMPSLTATYFWRTNAAGTAGEAISPADARTALGATTIGDSMFRLTNPSAISFPRFNANNTITALSAADFLDAIDAVASVATAGTVAGLTLTSSGTTTITITLGGTLAVNLASQVTGVLPIANGGTGASTAEDSLTALGLGTIATQDADSVNIIGGTIRDTSVTLNHEDVTVSGSTLTVNVFESSVFRVTPTANFTVDIVGTPQDATKPVPFRVVVTNPASWEVLGLTRNGAAITVFGWDEQTINLKPSGRTILDCLLHENQVDVFCYQMSVA